MQCECRRCMFQHFLIFFFFGLKMRTDLRGSDYIRQDTYVKQPYLTLKSALLDYMISTGPFQPTTFFNSNSNLPLAWFCPTYFFLGSFSCLATQSFFHHRWYQVLLNKSVCSHIDEGLHSQYSNWGSNLPCLQTHPIVSCSREML